MVGRTVCSVEKCIRFFFNDTATTEIYTLSLHDALPISRRRAHPRRREDPGREARGREEAELLEAPALALAVAPQPQQRVDRKRTPLNPHHPNISYAVFCF